MQRRIAELERDLAASTERVTTLEGEVKAGLLREEQLGEDLEAAEAQADKFAKQVLELTDAYNTCAAEANRLARELAASMTSLSALEAKVARWRADLASYTLLVLTPGQYAPRWNAGDAREYNRVGWAVDDDAIAITAKAPPAADPTWGEGGVGKVIPSGRGWFTGAWGVAGDGGLQPPGSYQGEAYDMKFGHYAPLDLSRLLSEEANVEPGTLCYWRVFGQGTNPVKLLNNTRVYLVPQARMSRLLTSGWTPIDGFQSMPGTLSDPAIPNDGAVA